MNIIFTSHESNIFYGSISQQARSLCNHSFSLYFVWFISIYNFFFFFWFSVLRSGWSGENFHTRTKNRKKWPKQRITNQSIVFCFRNEIYANLKITFSCIFSRSNFVSLRIRLEALDSNIKLVQYLFSLDETFSSPVFN